MDPRHLISLSASVVFVVLALGSAGSSQRGVSVDFDRAVDITVDGEELSVEEALERLAGAATDGEAEPGSEAPEGTCCCAFTEADAPVTRFVDEEVCRGVQGSCASDVSACVAAQEAIEEMADRCCCETTERIIPIGEACEGACYDFFEEGDTPGSCVY